ncbi:MAG: hypothetical protein US69_C0004G0011 [candidate division TM6 bacterium GW2011_GWF2_38_10]|nr:MAG: hypothetical protein US69_C0004G0011 [candidate division TM6 bacterium GW2011_GWF2_38_10]
MKNGYLFFIMSMGFCSSILASTLDGTSAVVYTDVHHVFYDGEYAQGFVALDDGFTVLAGACASMDILSPVDGGIDLREYGVLELDGDVTLDSQVSFSSGGHIVANGTMLSLNGNLSFPLTKTLHCKGSLCLNGNGKTLTFDNHAQLFLDQNSTLTLKNMVIKTKPYEAGVPVLTISSSSSKLCLDNVVLQLGGDFCVNNGQLFFHNDVVVTGTKAFVYRSGEPSFIAKNSCLYFDFGTTFSYVPTAANPSLIFCTDETSQLFFNGSSLKTSFTGMQVTKGSLLFDNDVLVDSFADDVVNDFGLLAGDIATSRTVVWSPRGNVIASVSSSNTLAVYRYNGTSWIAHGTKNLGGKIHHIAWSPDGRWVCALREVVHVFGESEITYSTTLYLERYYPTTGLSSTEEYTVAFDGIVTSLDWSTDGDYLAVAHSEYDTGVPSWTHQLRVYSFDGTAISLVDSGVDIGAMALSIAWNPHGRYIALAGAASSSELQLYSFNGTGIAHVQSVDMSGRCKLCTWSPDGCYLVVCRPNLYGDDYVNGIISTFNFTAGVLSLAGDAVTLTQFVPYSMEFSPCGKFIAMAGGQQYEMTPENISFARYGAGSNYNDVTSSLQYNTLVYGCLNKYTDCNSMFGDPYPNNVKTLQITYAGIPSAHTSGYTETAELDIFSIEPSGALRLYYFNKHGIAASYLEQVTFSGKVACDGHFNPSGNLMSIANPKNSWSLFNLFHTSTNTNYAYDSQSALVMGDGTAASDVAVTFCSGASVHIHGNMMYNPS